MSRIVISRREAFGGLALAAAALAGVSPAFAAPAAAFAPLAWNPKALTPDQARALEAVAEAIIPATDTPGAKAAGVPQFVDRAVAGYYGPAEARLIRAGLDIVDQDARAAHGAVFAALPPEQQAALLTRYGADRASERGRFFALVRELTTVGYFTSEPGATVALRYDPVPGDYRGCVPLSEIGRAWAI